MSKDNEEQMDISDDANAASNGASKSKTGEKHLEDDDGKKIEEKSNVRESTEGSVPLSPKPNDLTDTAVCTPKHVTPRVSFSTPVQNSLTSPSSTPKSSGTKRKKFTPEEKALREKVKQCNT